MIQGGNGARKQRNGVPKLLFFPKKEKIRKNCENVLKTVRFLSPRLGRSGTAYFATTPLVGFLPAWAHREHWKVPRPSSSSCRESTMSPIPVTLTFSEFATYTMDL
ncbi:hypothetical protein AVEN_214857-1 [Araneus ventricosus]|uniref:Uncharacterized protein n=1 Tax=Araneus ventricosus TaxID=182803 RepID=A0A4Y2HJT3_ARAVE|nr:hypothetical protein AVEN_214857-1 [Araneus ventricosus]